MDHPHLNVTLTDEDETADQEEQCDNRGSHQQHCFAINIGHDLAEVAYQWDANLVAGGDELQQNEDQHCAEYFEPSHNQSHDHQEQPSPPTLGAEKPQGSAECSHQFIHMPTPTCESAWWIGLGFSNLVSHEAQVA
jgi:hypothetical protein